MFRKFAVSAALATSGALVVTLGPLASPAVADPTVPDPTPTVTTAAPTASTSPTASPSPTATPTATTPAKSKPKPKAKKKQTKAQKALARAKKAVRYALSRVRSGQYVRGRSGPNSFDCSGLMVYSYRKIGIKLAHSSRALSTRGKKISRKNLKPGDLVFYYAPVSHVAMYIGNGKIVHARNPRADLDVTKLSQYPHYRWARRVLKF